MTEPTVDVVIATNRDSPYLAEAVDSVRAQTWTGWRIILVDDGSPSPGVSQEVIAGIEEALVVRQEPRGLPAARNVGILRGSGDLVAFLDDDDVWDPQKLERQVRAWQAAPHHVGIYSAGWYMDEDGQPFGDGWGAEQVPSWRFLSGEIPLPRIVTLVVRRDAWVALGGFDETFSMAEDLEFIMRLVQQGELLAVPEPLVGYRRHGFNMSAVGVSADGPRATERLLRMQIAAAQRRGDATTALLLREHLRRFRRNAAEPLVGGLIASARRRDSRALRDQISWAATSAPIETTGALLSRTSRAVGKRLRATRAG